MKRTIFHKSITFLAKKGLFDSLSDEGYLKLLFWSRMCRKLDLKHPRTFNEKVQWLKLYDRKPIYTTMVDKFEVKKYVADIIGKEYIIPTLGVWDKFDDINFEKLPNQFVLKCTHDSGGLVICKDKKFFDYDKARQRIEKSMRNNYYLHTREWPYKNIKPRIIAEEYMEDQETKELRDYKFYTFNGKTKALFIATGRQSNEETCFDYFDTEFNHLPFTWGQPNAKETPKKPFNFEKMIDIANKLSAGIPHVRVDLYEVNTKIFFGELTFCDGSGMTPIEPYEWDLKLGDWINLPIKGSIIH